jgi:hypothetical protein
MTKTNRKLSCDICDKMWSFVTARFIVLRQLGSLMSRVSTPLVGAISELFSIPRPLLYFVIVPCNCQQSYQIAFYCIISRSFCLGVSFKFCSPGLSAASSHATFGDPLERPRLGRLPDRSLLLSSLPFIYYRSRNCLYISPQPGTIGPSEEISRSAASSSFFLRRESSWEYTTSTCRLEYFGRLLTSDLISRAG